jgi:hypothetical protein
MEDVYITKSILHILDSQVGLPVLSEKEHPKSIETEFFLGEHLKRLMEDSELKECVFLQDRDNPVREILENYQQDPARFLSMSKDLAEKLFDYMTKNPEVPSSDLAVVAFHHKGQEYLGVLKFNYKQTFTHEVDHQDEGNINSIIQYQRTIASINQRIDEGFIVNLNDLKILLKEKKVKINDEKVFYLSQKFLLCKGKPSDKEKMDIINRTNKEVLKKHYDNDFKKTTDLKRAMVENFTDSEELEIEEISEKVFRDNPEARKDYREGIEKRGLTEPKVKLKPKTSEKLMKKQKIITEEGIELHVPVEYLDDRKVKFLNNGDGTIKIEINDITSILNK